MGAKHWTAEDEDYLRANFERQPAREIGRKLGRQKVAVLKKAARMVRDKTFLEPEAQWTQKQIEKLTSQWGSIPPRDIGRSLGLSVQKTAAEVRAKAAELGLPKLDYQKLSSRNWAYKEPKVLPDGMIEVAKGHVYSPESYALRMKAMSKPSCKTVSSCS